MWDILKSEYIYRLPWLVVRKDAVVTEKGVYIDDFYVLEYPTWVNVIAITTDGYFVIEQQYRHGIQSTVYELCAGICEKEENPMDAAKRELLEETGFGGGEWSFIDKFAPNPNSMNNWCYSYLAIGVSKIQDANQELTENIRVHQVKTEELLSMMMQGEIVEGVMLAPLWQFFFSQKDLKK